MTPFKTLTRQELYEQVWSMPMSRLAKQFHLSDQGLAKKCKKHNIPRPPVGYWAKLEHGKPVKKHPLPKNSTPALDAINFYRHPEANKNLTILENTLIDEHLDKALGYKISEKVSRYHPVISEYRKAVNKKSVDKYGRFYFRSDGCDIGFKITPNTFNRACLFLHGIIKLFESYGWVLGETKDYRGEKRSAFIFNDEALTFEVKEKVKQVHHIKTEKEKSERFYWGEKYDFIPTGTLEFSIENLSYSGLKMRWRDNKKGVLESQLSKIVHGFSLGFEYSKQQTIESERLRIEREREEKIREEARRIQKIEDNRQKYLFELTQAHQKAASIRSLIKAFENTEYKEEGFDEWLSWAVTVADTIDPIKRQAEIVLKHLGFEQEKDSFSWG